MNYKTDKEGQSLFEVIFAIALASLIMIAIVSLATVNIRNTTSSRNRSIASRYIQEAFEWLREERDKDWDIFASRTGTYCLKSTPLTAVWPAASTCADTDYVGTTKIFRRQVVLADVGSVGNPTIRVTIQVEWNDSEGLHMEESVIQFTRWGYEDFN